jgi:hypothetical protein
LIRYGQWKDQVAEITSYGELSDNPVEVIFEWLVDDGNSSRSQRKVLLNADYGTVGIDVGSHSTLGKVCARLCVREIEHNVR